MEREGEIERDRKENTERERARGASEWGCFAERREIERRRQAGMERSREVENQGGEGGLAEREERHSERKSDGDNGTERWREGVG